MLMKSYPKVNLGLYITGKKDNLHEIDSVFVEVRNDLFDTISVELEDGKGIDIECNFKINKEDNIVYKAFELMNKTYDFDKKVIVKLNKNIPMGAGLGGGSSNCGAFIRLMDILFDLDLGLEEMVDIAKQLGSDVPFFIHGGVCRVMGTGDIIIPIEGNVPDIELITNDFHMNTKEVFSNFDSKDCYVNNIEEIIAMIKLNKFELDKIQNDLLIAMFKTDKKFETHFEEQKKLNSNILISGSGSTLFMIK